MPHHPRGDLDGSRRPECRGKAVHVGQHGRLQSRVHQALLFKRERHEENSDKTSRQGNRKLLCLLHQLGFCQKRPHRHWYPRLAIFAVQEVVESTEKGASHVAGLVKAGSGAAGSTLAGDIEQAGSLLRREEFAHGVVTKGELLARRDGLRGLDGELVYLPAEGWNPAVWDT